MSPWCLITQTSNPHAMMLAFQSRSLRTNFLVEDVILLKGNSTGRIISEYTLLILPSKSQSNYKFRRLIKANSSKEKQEQLGLIYF